MARRSSDEDAAAIMSLRGMIALHRTSDFESLVRRGGKSLLGFEGDIAFVGGALDEARHAMREALYGAIGPKCKPVERTVTVRPEGLRRHKALLEELELFELAKLARYLKRRLLPEARAALPDIRAAAAEYWRRHAEEARARLEADEADFQRRVLEENPRRLTVEDVRRFLRKGGHEVPCGPIVASFKHALDRGLISEVEFKLAGRLYGDSFTHND